MECVGTGHHVVNKLFQDTMVSVTITQTHFMASKWTNTHRPGFSHICACMDDKVWLGSNVVDIKYGWDM